MQMRRSRDKEAELAALADGSISAARRAELEAQVQASPVLADRLAEQERAVALLRGAGDEVEAPASLRAAVAPRPVRTAPTPRRLALAAVATAVVAAAAVAVVVSRESAGARLQAALGPTPLAPQARGEATLTKTSSGWRIHLDASGLPRLARDRFYEAWLRGPGGALVSIGTFNEGRDVTLWAGVSPLNYKVLTVTRERADGNEASSGEKVLVGPVRSG